MTQEFNNHVFSVKNDMIVMFENALKPKPREIKDANAKDLKKIKPWGNDNNYPEWVLDQIKDVTLVEPIIDWKARALYSGGLVYGVEYIENNEEKFKRLIIPEIEEFLDETDILNYLTIASSNFYTYYNAMAELTVSRSGEKIAYLRALQTPTYRMGKKNNNGVIEKIYTSPNWEEYGEEHKEVKDITLFNPFHTSKEDIKKLAEKPLAYNLSNPSPGRHYYAKAPWHNILTTWLPIARAIPEFKKALLANQITIKYMVKVPEWWWEWRYPNFNKTSASERKKIVEQERANFEEFFAGKKQGNSLMYTQRDSTPAKTYGDWEVTVVDDKLKEGVYLEDSQEADAHIFKNMQVDPTLFGGTVGKDRSSAGSGSDKRVAWNNYMIMTKPHQDRILSPLQLIAKMNGWQEQYKENGKLVFRMNNYQIARLDSGKETTKETNPTPES